MIGENTNELGSDISYHIGETLNFMCTFRNDIHSLRLKSMV